MRIPVTQEGNRQTKAFEIHIVTRDAQGAGECCLISVSVSISISILFLFYYYYY